MSEFFEPPPPPPEPEEEPDHVQPPWHAPGENVIGGGVGMEVILVRTGDLAVSAERFLAYPNGVAFKLVRRFRTEEIGWGLDPDTGFHFRGRGPYREEEAKRRLRFGVRFPDGSKATDMSPWWHRDKPPEPPVIVQSGGGGGGGRYWSEGWWLWPLPPEGVFEFAIQWPAADIPLTFVEVDAGPIREAAGRAVELWPVKGRHPWSGSSVTTFEMGVAMKDPDDEEGSE